MKTYDFLLSNADTDSISIGKKDGAPFSEEEIKNLIAELNSLYPEGISFENDGYFDVFVVLRAKNYIMKSGEKISYKGSGLKNQNKEPALKEYMLAIVDILLDVNCVDKEAEALELYHKFIREAASIKDISRWAGKKTVTASVLAPKRSNEQKVLDALKGQEFSEGDKFFFFYLPDETLATTNNFNGVYHIDRMIEKVYNTSFLFENVLPIDKMFLNYKLKRNKKALELLLASSAE